MNIDDAINGGTTGVGLGPVVNTISTQLDALKTNLMNKLNQAGINTQNIDTIGKLASIIKDNGYPNVARLLAAVLLAKAVAVRTFGRLLGSDQFDYIVKEEFKDFPNSPSLQDMDSLIQEIESKLFGQGQQQQSTLTEVVEAIEEVTGEEEGGE